MRSVCVASVVGALCVWEVYRSLPPMDALSRRRALASTIRTMGTILWPVVLLSAVPREDHGHPALALPLMWNVLAWVLDAHLLHHAPSHSESVPASLRLEPQSITALTFGLCGLLGARPEGRHTHLFLFAVVGCIVLVLPSHNLKPGCLEEQVFESVQKAAIMWCIGLLIAGVVLTRTCQKSCSPTSSA